MKMFRAFCIPSRVVLSLLLSVLSCSYAFADPVLLAVHSRKTHGPAGEFNWPLDPLVPLGGAVSVEPRSGAGHTIVFLFDTPITSVTSASVVDINGTAVGTATPIVAGETELKVTLTAIPDNSRVKILLNGVNGAANFSVSVGFLIGDVNNTASVAPDDVQAVKSHSGQTANANNFQHDVRNTGLITASDISAVKAHLGFSIPISPAALTVDFAGTGGGQVTSSPAGVSCCALCTHSFNLNAQVTLTATPNNLSAFNGWSGACAGTNASAQVVVTGGNTCVATFTALPQFILTVTKTGAGTGTVTSTPAGINCGATCTASVVQGANTQLAASPAAGSNFSGWSGACSGTQVTTTVALNAAGTCTC